MICSHKIYKGEDVEVSIPFRVEGWSDLRVEYYTDGGYKVTRTADELEIDEYTITAEFSDNDLDLLGDGVLYYSIYYVYDGQDYIKSSNTPYVLKTPKAYSAMTPTDYYHEGEVVGKAQGYISGYTTGESNGYTHAVSDVRNNAISLSVSANGTYSANTEDSIYFREVNVNVPQSSGGSVDLSWAGKSCAFEGVDWVHGEDPEDEYDYQPFFTLPNIEYFDQLTLDVFILDTNFEYYILSTENLDDTRGSYINIKSKSSGFQIEYRDGTGGDLEINLPCTMYAHSNYHIEIAMSTSRDNLTAIVVGPDGQNVVSASTLVVGFSPRRVVCINGVYDSDYRIYDYVRGGFMFRNMRVYGTGSLVHNYQWYDGHIVDTISGNAYYGWHYYWDEDEEQWDTEIKYMNGYNDAYKN